MLLVGDYGRKRTADKKLILTMYINSLHHSSIGHMHSIHREFLESVHVASQLHVGMEYCLISLIIQSFCTYFIIIFQSNVQTVLRNTNLCATEISYISS